MTRITHIASLEEAASSQWGIFTTSQAAIFGVSRQQIHAACKNGSLEKLFHGVYRFNAGAEAPFVDIKAAWIDASPKEMAYDRLLKASPDAVATGATASALYNIGSLYADPYTFITPKRKQTSRQNVRYITSAVESDDWLVKEGIPCAKPARIVADLVRMHEDPSLVKDVAIEFEDNGIRVDTIRLASLLSPLAQRSGYPKNDGQAFVNAIFAGYEKLDFMRARDKALRISKEHSDKFAKLQASLSKLDGTERVFTAAQKAIDKMKADGTFDRINSMQKQLDTFNEKNAKSLSLANRIKEQIVNDPEMTRATKFAEQVTAANERAFGDVIKTAEAASAVIESSDQFQKAMASARRAAIKYAERPVDAADI